jgi:hypothetical protein
VVLLGLTLARAARYDRDRGRFRGTTPAIVGPAIVRQPRRQRSGQRGPPARSCDGYRNMAVGSNGYRSHRINVPRSVTRTMMPCVSINVLASLSLPWRRTRRGSGDGAASAVGIAPWPDHSAPRRPGGSLANRSEQIVVAVRRAGILACTHPFAGQTPANDCTERCGAAAPGRQAGRTSRD